MSQEAKTQEDLGFLQASKVSLNEMLTNLENMVPNKSETNTYAFQCYNICEMALDDNEKKSIGDNIDKIIDLSISVFLSSNSRLRWITIRLLRYCLLNKNIWLKYMQKRIDFYITQTLDCGDREKEIEQGLKLLVNASTSYPDNIPESLISCIQAHCGDINKYEDKFDSVYIFMFCSMIMESPDMLRLPCVKNTFYNLLSKINHKESLECLIDVLLYTVEYISPNSARTYNKLNYFRIVTPMELKTNTDCKVNFCTVTHVYTKMNELSAYPSNMTLKFILNTWTGIFDYGMDPLGLTTTLSQLPYEDIPFQVQFVTLLYDLVGSPLPEYKNSLIDTLGNYISIYDNYNDNNYPNVSNTACIAEEALHDVQSIHGPPIHIIDMDKIKRTYKILVLYHCDILKYLTLLIMDTVNMELKTIFVILLGELIFQIDTLLPTLCTHGMGILDELRHKIHPKQNDVMTKFDFVVRSVCQYISWKCQFGFIANFSLLTYSYFYHLPKLETHKNFPYKNKSNNYSTDRGDASNTSTVSKDNDVLSDEIISIEHMCSNSPNNWNWETLIKLFFHPELFTLEKENTAITKIVQHLLNFYSFSYKSNSYKRLENADMKVITLTGVTLVRYLSIMEPVSSFAELITSYYKNLSEVIIPSDKTDNIQAYAECAKTLEDATSDCRLNIVVFMLVTAMKNPVLVEYLHRADIYIKLEYLCEMSECTKFFKNLIISMEYTLNSPSYLILKRCLSSQSNYNLRLFCTKFLRVILRTNIEGFDSWALNLLVGMIWDNRSEIVKEALSIIDEVLLNKSLVYKLYQMKISFKSIPDAEKLVSRFMCVPLIITNCIKNGYAKFLLIEWKTRYYFEYPNWVQDMIHSHTDDNYVKSFFPHSISPPYHLYGELSQTNEGFDLLLNNKIIDKIVFDLNKNYLINMDNTFLNILPSLWAIGHIGSTLLGINYLLKIHPQIVRILTKIVHMSTKFYSVKGVAICVLNMLKSTKIGSSELDKWGWTKNSFTIDIKNAIMSNKERSSSAIQRTMSNSLEDIRIDKLEFSLYKATHSNYLSLNRKPRSERYSKKEENPVLQNVPPVNENVLEIAAATSTKATSPREIGRSTSTYKIERKRLKMNSPKKSSSINWKGVSSRMKNFLITRKLSRNKRNYNYGSGGYRHSGMLHQNYRQIETFLSVSTENINSISNDSIDLTIASKCFFSYFSHSVLLPDNYQSIKSFFKLNFKFSNKNKYDNVQVELKPTESKENLLPTNQKSNKSFNAMAQVNQQNYEYNCVLCGPNSKCINLLLKHDSGTRSPTLSNEIFQSTKNLAASHSYSYNAKDSNQHNGKAVSELLRVIFLIVTSKLTTGLEKSLKFIKTFYPSLFKSLCVYDKCMYIADHYNGSLESRQMIHKLFEGAEKPTIRMSSCQNA